MIVFTFSSLEYILLKYREDPARALIGQKPMSYLTNKEA